MELQRSSIYVTNMNGQVTGKYYQTEIISLIKKNLLYTQEQE